MTCRNSETYIFPQNTRLSCKRIRFNEPRRQQLCTFPEVRTNCPQTCGICCDDDPLFTFGTNSGDVRSCAWLSDDTNRADFWCDRSPSGGGIIRDRCPVTCGYCFALVGSISPSASSMPTASHSVAPTSTPSSFLQRRSIVTLEPSAVQGVFIGAESEAVSETRDNAKWAWWLGFAGAVVVLAAIKIVRQHVKRSVIVTKEVPKQESIGDSLDLEEDYLSENELEEAGSQKLGETTHTKHSDEDSIFNSEEEDNGRTEIGMIVSYEARSTVTEEIIMYEGETDEENTLNTLTSEFDTVVNRESNVNMKRNQSKTDSMNTQLDPVLRKKSESGCCDHRCETWPCCAKFMPSVSVDYMMNDFNGDKNH